MKKTVLLAKAVLMLIGSVTANQMFTEVSDSDVYASQIENYMNLMDQSAAVSFMTKLEYFQQNIEKNEQLTDRKYSHPPEWLANEYENDGIADKWEGESEADYEPIIGILTQPIRFKNGSDTDKSYILESNDNFQKWSGTRTIAIPYDISERALIDLLGNINGVHLTGGGLELIDKHGNQHPYYVTARRIINFSKMQKQRYNVEFPVLGICQGLEVISVVQGGDDIDTLDKILAFGMRKVDWIENRKSRFFQEFPESLRNQMQEKRSGLHLHEFSVSFETYNKKGGLRDEMVIIQKDKLKDVDFIDAMEHKKYPIFAMMYHPEYPVVKNVKFPGSEKTKSFTHMTDEIAFRTSLSLNRWARKNDFRWTLGEENLVRLAVNRVPLVKSKFFNSYVYQKLDLSN